MGFVLSTIGNSWKLLPSWARLRITRATQHKFTASVVGIITNEKGELLLLDHLLRPASGWGLPGGFINPGEQPEAAIRREIREETGLELTDITLYRVRTLKRHVEILFMARSTGVGVIGSREIKEIRWCHPNDIPREMNLDQQFLIHKIFQADV
ncbi:MAG: NUDIX domain-containing protein [Pyrinomonadaceae bacterium]|nr:NUDIX domain-containing protein [Acidobacteriota bacterium]MBP7375362.1 NUDIX domain-containing protein [Pyrinomonadaceae bacterium]